jgi:hypothetical protein
MGTFEVGGGSEAIDRVVNAENAYLSRYSKFKFSSCSPAHGEYRKKI